MQTRQLSEGASAQAAEQGEPLLYQEERHPEPVDPRQPGHRPHRHTEDHPEQPHPDLHRQADLKNTQGAHRTVTLAAARTTTAPAVRQATVAAVRQVHPTTQGVRHQEADTAAGDTPVAEAEEATAEVHQEVTDDNNNI